MPFGWVRTTHNDWQRSLNQQTPPASLGNHYCSREGLAQDLRSAREEFVWISSEACARLAWNVVVACGLHDAYMGSHQCSRFACVGRPFGWVAGRVRGARVGFGGARVAFVYKGWHVSIVGQGTFVHVKGFGQLHDVLQGAAVHSAAQCCGLV